MDRAWCGAELMLSHSLSAVNTIMNVPREFKFKNQFGFDLSTSIMPDPAAGTIFAPFGRSFLTLASVITDVILSTRVSYFWVVPTIFTERRLITSMEHNEI